MGIFKRNRQNKKPADIKPIESFENITLNISGMRFRSVYEIRMNDDKAEITEYNIRFVDKEDKKEVESQILCDKEEILKLLNDCELSRWDGFVGNHPKDVSDGIMFTLEATVNGGQSIYAHGSENFPEHYRDLTERLRGLLNGKE